MPKTDVHEAVILSHLLFIHTEFIEIRTIECWTENDKRQSAVGQVLWLHPSEFEDHIPALQQANANRYNIFFGVCPRPQRKGTKDSIRTVPALWADIDKCSTDLAIRRCVDAGVAIPDIVIGSGHGAHLYWTPQEVFHIETAADRTKAEAAMREIADLIGGDHVQNVDRLLRLPGFLNVKNARNDAKPTPCRIVRAEPRGDSPAESVDHLINMLPEQSQYRIAGEIEKPTVATTGSGRKITPKHAERIRRELELHSNDRSSREWAVTNTLLEQGFSADSIADVVAGVGKFRGRPKYLKSTIGKSVKRRNNGDNHKGGRTAAPESIATADLIRGIIRLSDVHPQPLRWLWAGRFPLGKLTLIAGDPGLGKSLATIDMVARVSRGQSWPDRPDEHVEPGGVVLLSAEDDVADTIRPRLDAAQGDASQVVLIDAVERTDLRTGKSRMHGFSLESDLEHLIAAIGMVRDCKLVVIDPISAYIGGRTDSHKNAEVRAVLAPLASLAAKHGVAVLCVTHLRKGEGRAMYRSMGSLAFVAASRSAWIVCPHPNEPETRLLLSVKQNLSAPPDGLSYQIATVGPLTTPVVQWGEEPVTMTADEALDAMQGPGRAAKKAAEWLKTTLANGSMSSSDLRAAADAAGLSWRTVERAKSAAGARCLKSGFGIGGWSWTLR